ncbi:hypothetical protein [Chryseobacterium sp. MFBS3-17]|uniref:hypothetical protein n=1 Tax=Chryseobacterium sp. MFBS3-17 TaxID=2886689 RepID=UPI001D0E769E|nr:hypothetical protein [Chryseobacterium sp. MFBS3-17]MCC2591756.1 hypothetical protein [Chryseobacterium sp. MFBS3-17]
MKTLFQKKISIRQVKEIEKHLIENLNKFDENFAFVYSKKISEITNIYFTINPKGISLMREIKDKNGYTQIRKSFNEILNINGIKFFNNKTKSFENIPCSFANYNLNFIGTENPEKFHKVYDINKIQIEKLDIKSIAIQNPDKVIVEKILQSFDMKDKRKLELEFCFEIEFENDKYYTVLNFENGNYIAIDRKANVYYLNHDSEIRIRKISEDISEFISHFDGNKLELEKTLE